MIHAKTKLFTFGLILILVLSIFYYNYRKNAADRRDFIVVGRGDIVQQITLTGTVKPVESVALGFEKVGRINKIGVKIGDSVIPGQLLASLDARDSLARLAQSQASLESTRALLSQYEAIVLAEEVKLLELKNGPRAEEIAISQSKVDAAKTALKDADENLINVQAKAAADLDNIYINLPEVLNDALIKADDAVTKQTDDLFINDEDTNPQLAFQVTAGQVESDFKTLRLAMTTVLRGWRSELAAIQSSDTQTSLDNNLSNSKKNLFKVRDYMAKAMDALNNSSGLANSTISAYKANVTLGRTNVNSALTSLNSQQEAIISQRLANQNALSSAKANVNDANSNLLASQSELNLKLAGSSPEQIAGQEARIKQAQANVASQKAQIKRGLAEVQANQADIAKAQLRSTINGVVTRQDGRVGTIVTASTPIISIISDASLEIEANVPEVDISRVALQNPVNIVLDAAPLEKITGRVMYIEPAETVIDGVVNYKVKINFDEPNEKIKSGLTASLYIETNRKSDVVVVPQVALIERDGGFMVKKYTEGGTVDIPIQIGLMSIDGSSEVISGLNAGDKVVNMALKNK